MARWTRLCLPAAALLAGGCASRPAPPREPSRSADLDAWLDAEEPSGGARSVVLHRTLSPAPDEGTAGPPAWTRGPLTLSTPASSPARPQRRPLIDVSFQKADMQSAFQLLADAGRFNLVIQEGLTGQVSASLRRIDPYDALTAVAAANGIDVRYDGLVVVVKKR
jgi:hypothetical protein